MRTEDLYHIFLSKQVIPPVYTLSYILHEKLLFSLSTICSLHYPKRLRLRPRDEGGHKEQPKVAECSHGSRGSSFPAG